MISNVLTRYLSLWAVKRPCALSHPSLYEMICLVHHDDRITRELCCYLLGIRANQPSRKQRMPGNDLGNRSHIRRTNIYRIIFAWLSLSLALWIPITTLEGNFLFGKMGRPKLQRLCAKAPLLVRTRHSVKSSPGLSYFSCLIFSTPCFSWEPASGH